MLRIFEDRLFDESGRLLKTFTCPKKVSDADLVIAKVQKAVCHYCNREVFNTDYMSEDQIIALLTNNPDTCLKINRLNPLFRIETKDL